MTYDNGKNGRPNNDIEAGHKQKKGQRMEVLEKEQGKPSFRDNLTRLFINNNIIVIEIQLLLTLLFEYNYKNNEIYFI